MAMQFTPGRYFGRIKNQGFGKTKDQQSDTFFLQFDIVGKINPEDPEGNLLSSNPGERTAYWTLKTDKNAEYFVKDMRKLGCPMTSFGMLDPGQPNFHNLAGVEYEFVCEENNYDNKQSERWKIGGSGGEGPKAVPLDAKNARRLDALFGAALKGDGAQPKQRSVAKPNGSKPNGDPNAELLAEGAAHRGDDIPF